MAQQEVKEKVLTGGSQDDVSVDRQEQHGQIL